MKTWFNVFNLLALFCLIYMTDCLYREIRLYENEYNEQRLIRVVEYASEKAFYDSIGTKSNNTDYENQVQVTVDPGKTLDSFDIMVEMNYGLSLSESSHIVVEDSVAAMSLMTNDGYYLAGLQETREDELRLYWTPKYPYTFEVTEGDRTYTYAVTLADENWQKVSRDDGGGLAYARGTSYAQDGTAGILTDETRRLAVSRTLTDALSLSMERNSLTRDDVPYALYIPSRQTLGGINSISTPSFLVVLRGAGYAGVDDTLDAAITGLKVIRKIRVIGYEAADGRLKYCRESQGAGETHTILQYFASEEEAARAGYIPDYDYLFNKVDTSLLSGTR